MNKTISHGGSIRYAFLLKRAPLLALALWSPFCAAGEAGEVTVETPREEPTVVTRPLPEGVPALQMSTDYAHPALGFGTYTPISQVAARAIRVAPFNVRASVQGGAGYDDNVGLSKTNKVSSMFYTVAPSIAVGLDGATQRYYAAYRGNYGVFGASSQDSYADHNVTLSAANSWTGRFRTLASYDFLRGHNGRGVTVSSTTGVEEWTAQTLRGSASYGAAGAKARLDGDVTYSNRRYSDESVVRDTADFDQLGAGGTISYRLAPKTRALVQIAWNDFSHPGDSSLDNTEMRYLVGVTWEALAKTTGRVRVGYTTKDFPNSVRPDFSGQSYDAGVTWTPQPYSTFDFGASRFLSESYEVGSSLVVNTVATVVWNHQWPRGIRSTVNAALGETRQEGLNRTDNYQNYAARVSYGIRPSLRVGAEWRHDVRESDASGLNYTRNIILITVETAL